MSVEIKIELDEEVYQILQHDIQGDVSEFLRGLCIGFAEGRILEGANPELLQEYMSMPSPIKQRLARLVEKRAG